MQDFEDGPSEQSLDAIFHLKIEIMKLNPMRAGSSIPLPRDIANKVACTNQQNMDNKCMFFAIFAGLYLQKSHSEISYYTDGP